MLYMTKINNKNKATEAATDTQYLLNASEALATETNPVALQKILMRCLLERSGVDECYFFLIINHKSKNLVSHNHDNKLDKTHHCSLHGSLDASLNGAPHGHQNQGLNNAEITFNLDPDGIPLNYNEAIIRACKATLQTITLNDTHSQGIYQSEAEIANNKNNKVKSILCKPIVHQQKLLAIIYLHDHSRENVFDQHLLTFIELLAKQAAITISNYQLFQKQTYLNNKITQTQKTLEAIFNTTRHYFLIINTDATIIKANTSAMKDFGIVETDLLEKKLWETPRYENTTKLKKDIKHYFFKCLTEGTQIFETCHHHPNNENELSYFENTYSQAFDNNGQLKFIIFESHDISKIKKSEALFRQFFQQYPISTAMTNPDGTIHLINPACEKAWGIKQKTITDQGYNILKDKSFIKSQKAKKLIQKAFTGKTVYLEDIEFTLDPESGAMWVRIIGFPIKDESGKLIHVVFTHQIVTREVEALHDIELHRRHLQEMVEERTRNLEAANEELKSFAYIVSHDLKAPLRAITQLSHWLIEDYPDKLEAEGKQKLLLIGDRANRMNNMIEGILQYSRIGRSKEEWEEVDLKKLIDETIDLLAPPKTIHIDIAQGLPTLRCEKTRMLQVFQNLIENAIKYIDKEDGLIELGFMENENNWQFFVKDNGPGIHPKHQQRIFQMFQTLHNKEDINSTGIGLAIVKKTVDQWQGLLWIESTPGQGSCFHFTFPKHQ